MKNLIPIFTSFAVVVAMAILGYQPVETTYGQRSLAAVSAPSADDCADASVNQAMSDAEFAEMCIKDQSVEIDKKIYDIKDIEISTRKLLGQDKVSTTLKFAEAGVDCTDCQMQITLTGNLKDLLNISSAAYKNLESGMKKAISEKAKDAKAAAEKAEEEAAKERRCEGKSKAKLAKCAEDKLLAEEKGKLELDEDDRDALITSLEEAYFEMYSSGKCNIELSSMTPYGMSYSTQWDTRLGRSSIMNEQYPNQYNNLYYRFGRNNPNLSQTGFLAPSSKACYKSKAYSKLPTDVQESIDQGRLWGSMQAEMKGFKARSTDILRQYQYAQRNPNDPMNQIRLQSLTRQAQGLEEEYFWYNQFMGTMGDTGYGLGSEAAQIASNYDALYMSSIQAVLGNSTGFADDIYLRNGNSGNFNSNFTNTRLGRSNNYMGSNMGSNTGQRGSFDAPTNGWGSFSPLRN